MDERCQEDSDKVELCSAEREKEEEVELKMKFQVADVKKPLLAVCRVAEKGNKVIFGPEDEDNYILNIRTGRKIPLLKNGRGSYLLEVWMSGEKTIITVDSGAEESVCPKEWGSTFPTKPCKAIKFRGAGGEEIKHYGERDVVVKTSF